MTEYLLLPMQPTPNGRMHIGHGGGTYLRADVVSRYLSSRGHIVSMVSGSDAHENWVLAESARTGIEPTLVCAQYHAEIEADLRSMRIGLDAWIDPLAEEHAGKYREVHERNLTNLKTTGAAVLEQESIPLSTATGEAMTGTWIAGECPTCGADAGGSSCVKCGDHFQPEELLNPRSRLDDSPLTWGTVNSWFARPLDDESISEAIRGRDLRDAIAEPALRYIGAKGGRVRLSGAGRWGIKSELVPDDAVLMNSYYLYSVYCAETYQRTRGLTLSPMDPASPVITVGFFGTDNTTPGIVVPEVLAQGSPGLLRPFDHTVVNGMLKFEGQKCSTSKRHGIWITEILGGGLITSDELRFALGQACLDYGPDDITLVQLADRVNFLRSHVMLCLSKSWEDLGTLTTLGTHRTLDSAFVEQDNAMSLAQLDIARAVEIMTDWIETRDSVGAEEWVVGLALLFWPIAPDFAAEVWTSLGLPGHPSTTALSESLELRPEAREWKERPVLSPESLLPFVHRADVA